MAGYSGTPLSVKLGIKETSTVFLDGAPATVADHLRESGKGEFVAEPRPGLDLSVTFHTNYHSLSVRLPELLALTTTDGMVWVAWPKKAAHRKLREQGVEVDLDENVVRTEGLALGWVDVKVCAIDEVWSGLKFVRRLTDR